MKARNYFLFILLIVIFISCEDDTGFTPPLKEAEDLTDEGWEKFGYGAYSGALAKFLEAIDKDSTYAEAYSGAGWASARLTNLSDAVSYFAECFSLNSSHADAHAGLAFVYNAMKEYQLSINSANAALGYISNWVFPYDQNLSYQDLNLIKAEGYFALGDYGSSLTIVQLLNPAFVADVQTFAGRSELAEEIERLRGVV